MAQIRAFIAIELNDVVRSQLFVLQQQLCRVDATVAWARPEGMHLTLKFLGNVPEEHLPSLGDALAAIAHRYAPFAVTIAGTGGFPHLRRPRVLWVGVHAEDTPLSALAQEIDFAVAEYGIPRDAHPFHPHLTLGRVKGVYNPRLTPILEQHGDALFGEVRVHELVLYRSELSAQGAHYTALRRVPLAGDVTST